MNKKEKEKRKKERKKERKKRKKERRDIRALKHSSIIFYLSCNHVLKN